MLGHGDSTLGEEPTLPVEPVAAVRYLLLADISGYTAFLSGVEGAHGVDFAGGLPAGYEILGRLLTAVIEGVESTFSIVKVEGDAVFAIAAAAELDGRGMELLPQLRRTYEAFTTCRTDARSATDHQCTSCEAVSGLDLKMVLHRGPAVRQRMGTNTDVIGPAVTVAHRLLKNTVRSRVAIGSYLFVTNAAATSLGLSDEGVPHSEVYDDVGLVEGRVLDLADVFTVDPDAISLA
jgi:class 3 adenylate cyclase